MAFIAATRIPDLTHVTINTDHIVFAEPGEDGGTKLSLSPQGGPGAPYPVTIRQDYEYISKLLVLIGSEGPADESRSE
ncbi:hypothetical protein [Neorhizobium sp. T25_13]|uniref:hypothetical protein n=1 Tax=Neorhizobium sp. T25_13 TaxID=2093830 RepID=UPI000CFA1DE9|nr:hypothetical protein [Neorhizobium sp. T25_13]